MAVRAQYVIEGPGGEKCVPAPPPATEQPHPADDE
jgi:hypothetical protein